MRHDFVFLSPFIFILERNLVLRPDLFFLLLRILLRDSLRSEQVSSIDIKTEDIRFTILQWITWIVIDLWSSRHSEDRETNSNLLFFFVDVIIFSWTPKYSRGFLLLLLLFFFLLFFSLFCVTFHFTEWKVMREHLLSQLIMENADDSPNVYLQFYLQFYSNIARPRGIAYALRSI